jgi:hypothetical protein
MLVCLRGWLPQLIPSRGISTMRTASGVKLALESCNRPGDDWCNLVD